MAGILFLPILNHSAENVDHVRVELAAGATPNLHHGLLVAMVERIEEEFDRVQDLSTSRVERRLARLLLRLAQSLGRKDASWRCH
jgi:CRP-like cAMP-binding protein